MPAVGVDEGQESANTVRGILELLLQMLLLEEVILLDKVWELVFKRELE